MLEKYVRNILLSTGMLLAVTSTHVMAGWEDLDLPPPQKVKKQDPKFIETLFGIYKARTRPLFFMQGVIPKQPADFREEVDAAVNDGVALARRFKILELLGRRTPDVRIEENEDDPYFVYTKDKGAARKMIEELAFQGDPFAATCFIKGRLKGKFGFRKLEGEKRQTFLKKFATMGYTRARTYMVEGYVEGKYGYPVNPEKANTLRLSWAREGDSQKRVSYLRTNFEEIPAVVREMTQKWIAEGDQYVARHFNPDYEAALQELARQRRAALKSELQSTNQIPASLTNFDLGNLEDWQITVFLQGLRSIKGGRENAKSSFEKETQSLMEENLRVSLPYAKIGSKHAREKVLASFKKVHPEKVGETLLEWANEGDVWAQKEYVGHLLDLAEEKAGKGGAKTIRAFLSDQQASEDLKASEGYKNSALQHMQKWNVVPPRVKMNFKT